MKERQKIILSYLTVLKQNNSTQKVSVQKTIGVETHLTNIHTTLISAYCIDTNTTSNNMAWKASHHSFNHLEPLKAINSSFNNMILFMRERVLSPFYISCKRQNFIR